MGREVRRVPPTWEHPRDARGNYIPLYGWSFAKRLKEWDEEQASYRPEDHDGCSSVDWHGERPKAEDYMPDWPESERTHYQMYEDTSEGTPISPVMESPESLARWLVDNKASAFAGMPASYEAWLRVAKGGFAWSAVLTIRGDKAVFESGVEAAARRDEEKE